MDDDIEKKKAKGINKCVIKCRLMFQNYKDSLLIIKPYYNHN